MMALLLALPACVGTKQVRLYDDATVRPEDVARVIAPIDIEVIRVDGSDVGDLADILIGYKNEILLSPGEHEIMVRYNDFWEYNKDSFEKLVSGKIVMRLTAEPGHFYRLAHPRLRDIEDAKKFSDNPEFWIEEIEKSADATTAESGEASGKSRPVSQVKPVSRAEQNKASAGEDDAALKKDWDNMSEEEKQKFREWMEQRNKE